MNTLINLGDYIILIHNTAAENYDSRIKYENERRQTAHYFVYPIIYYRSYCSIMKIFGSKISRPVSSFPVPSLTILISADVEAYIS